MTNYNRKNARWAGISFEVVTVSGGAPRRIASYEGTYREGAVNVDLGRQPRIEVHRAKLTKDDYLKLEKAVNAKRPRLFTHPVFGVSYLARLNLPSYNWANKSHGEIDIQVIEEGAQALSITSPSADQRASQTSALWDDVQEAIDAIETTPDSVSDASDDLSESWTDLHQKTHLAEQGEATWADVDRSLNAFSDLADTLIEQLRELDEETSSWNAVDGLIRAYDATVQFVDSTRAVPEHRAKIKIDGDTDIYTWAFHTWGHGDYVDTILAYNDEVIIDPWMITAGMELEIPPF